MLSYFSPRSRRRHAARSTAPSAKSKLSLTMLECRDVPSADPIVLPPPGDPAILAALEPRTVAIATDALNVSGTPDFLTEKSKLDVMTVYMPARTADGTPLPGTVKPQLITYTDAGPTGAQDTFIAMSFDDGATWKKCNLSRSADLSSFTLGNGSTYYGDSVKPVIAVAGRNMFVAWTSKYAPSNTPDSVSSAFGRTDAFGVAGAQGSVDYTAEYPDLGEVPYRAVWIARGTVQTDGTVIWQQAEQVTSGVRDAIQVAVAGAGGAGFAVTWQEDPAGLQPGEALGPGDGFTGTIVSDGTDVWYSYITAIDFTKTVADPTDPDGRPTKLVPMSSPVRVTNNDGGTTGASRPNLFLQAIRDASGVVTGAEAILGYEESKGTGDTGKAVFYHHFADFKAPDTVAAGDLLSDPTLNARRVRFVLQPKSQAGASGTVLTALYRQSAGGHDSPADIFIRRAVGDYEFTSFQPEVNLSSAGLDDAWDTNPTDNARAHRGIIRGDFMMLGYTQTPDAVAAEVGSENYDFFVRRSFDGGVTWEVALNVSNLPDNTYSVIEPRIVGTPSTITNTNGTPTGNPEDIQNPDVIFLAYGTAFNAPGGDEDEDSDSKNSADIFYSRTTDGGDTYRLVLDPVTGTYRFAPLAIGPAAQAETQIRSTPAGDSMYAVWNHSGLDEVTGVVGSDAYYRQVAFTSSVDFYTVGAGDSGMVRQFGLDGTPIREINAFPGFTGGVHVARGDVNGDQVPDIVVGAGHGGGPHVKVYDGMTGDLLQSFYAYASSFTGGVNVAVGDLDGDGKAEIVTGAGVGGAPHVKVFDGATLAKLRSFYAYDSSAIGGVSVAVGDVTGDGTADIVTGAGTGGGPHVKVFDGKAEAEVMSFFAFESTFTGGVNVAVGNVVGDGRMDIIAGPGMGGGPRVRVFDGHDLSSVTNVLTFDESFRGGIRVAAVDQDGDGLSELLIGSGPGGMPRVQVLEPVTLNVLGDFLEFDAADASGVWVG